MKWLIRFVRSSLSRRLSFWVVVLVAAIFTAAFALMFSETRDVVRQEAWDKATKTIEGAVLHIDNTLHRTRFIVPRWLPTTCWWSSRVILTIPTSCST